MKDGLIQQVDTPQNLYDGPDNLFVAGFIGTPQMNFIDCNVQQRNGSIYLTFGEDNSIKLPADKSNNPIMKDYIDKDVIMGIRPEHIHDDVEFIQKNPDTTIETDVEVTELMGAEIYLYINTEDISLTARVPSESKARAGDVIRVAFDASKIHLFDKDTERYIIH